MNKAMDEAKDDNVDKDISEDNKENESKSSEESKSSSCQFHGVHLRRALSCPFAGSGGSTTIDGDDRLIECTEGEMKCGTECIDLR